MQKLNITLQTSLQSYHAEAQQRVADHIRAHFKEAINPENWIRQGLAQNNGESCQFCGQPLSSEALQLLEIYRQSFDSAYEEHDKHIKHKIREGQLIITKERINVLKIAIEANNTALKSFPELEEENNYLLLVEQINLLINQLNDAFTQWEQYQIQLKEELNYAVTQKQASPHKEFEKLKFDILLQIDEKITEDIHQYNNLTEEVNTIFQRFKASVIDNNIPQRLDDISRLGNAEKRKLHRLELAEQCSDYIKFDLIVTQLKKEIPLLEDELLSEQSDYLIQFFDRLNRYFKLFGSNDFQLDKGLNTKGHKPIYYLKVKFYGIDISEQNLDRVFSESDRRSLALAVFWADLAGLNEIEKKNTIVILDDPVTSFDNHRISIVHQEIVSISDKFRQVILLSHFEQGISSFLNTYRNNKPIKLLSIEKEGNYSEIKVSDIEHFIKSSHEKERDNIFKFVQGITNTHNVGDLRVFLEIEINYRFAKQIMDINEPKLSDRIDRLKDIKAISDETATEAHTWRNRLNPAHHIWVGTDLEDQRHTAEQFMNFIYHRLIPH